MAAPDVDPAMYAAINRAISKAVMKIKQDIRPYLKYMIREVPADVMKLTEDDFYLPRFRDVPPRPYTRDEYEHLHGWMMSWGLLKPESNYDRIIGATLAASA